MSFYTYNGFLNIYKESGWTSMDVCQKLKGILGVRKIGHAGTLDPMAEGVLPVAVGKATRDVERIGECAKCYRAVMLLGTVTDTEDITGKVISAYAGAMPEETDIKNAVLSFEGEYDQLTPMYSARKVGGKKLYEYARKGQEAERKRKTVHIYSISTDFIDIPRVGITVSCSRGTYIRTLCSDIGARLGCGACMQSLTRLSVGDFYVHDALKVSDIEALRNSGDLDRAFRVIAPTAVAIGKFDGTHVGHQALINELRKTAAEKKLRSLAIVLTSGSADSVMSGAERKKSLSGLGVDYCVTLKFSEEFKHISAEDFLKNLLIKKYNMKAIVAGDDVSFGRDRQGNADFLKARSAEYGYEVKLIRKVGVELDEGAAAPSAARGLSHSTIVSSTLIKDEIKKGSMLHVTRLMGSPLTYSGDIVHGRHIGSSLLKLPTFNILVQEDHVLPPFGVYAVCYEIYDRDRIVCRGRGIANLGYSPTVTEHDEKPPLRLETHAFDDIGDCYSLKARVSLMYFVRGEKRFSDLTELRTQIVERDVPEAVDFFKTLA